MSRSAQPAPGPLSRRFDVGSVKERSLPVRLETSPAERQALAADCDLPGIDALAADFRVAREGLDGIRVTGRVTARVRRICVVSLEEFTSDLDEPVDVLFAPQSQVEAMVAERAARSTPEDEDEDPPDPIVAGRIDLGSLAAEILVLGLDPYPRKPGIVFAEPENSAETSQPSPFAVLRAIKDRDEA